MATTFTVGSGDYMRPWRNCRIQHFPVHVSQTLKRGYVVQLAGAGYENRIIASTDTVTTKIVGVVAADITTTATHVASTDKVPVWLATEDAEFIARTVADDAVDFSDIGVNVSLEIDVTNSIVRVETDDTTYETVKVLQFIDPVTKTKQATEGDTSVWAVVKFIPGAAVWGPGIILQ
jgi:hypothetical protein